MSLVLTFPAGPLQTNSYLLTHKGQALIVDPSGSAEEILEKIKELNCCLMAILCTHLHFDHVYAISDYVNSVPSISVYASQNDEVIKDSELGQGGMWGMPKVAPYTYLAIQEGRQQFLDLECLVLATPGHSPGSLVFYFPELKLLFSGDTLFRRSVGRADFPWSNQEDLMDSIYTKLYALPNDTIVYPGHGDPTSIGEEKIENPFIQSNRC